MSIGMERVGSTYFMTLRVVGKLTHEDYQIITPTIESALSGVDVPEIHALIDGRELEGWELRAAWDDFRLGAKHGKEFSKIAILGNRSWQEAAAKLGSWFISGDVRFFEDEDAAVKWLHE